MRRLLELEKAFWNNTSISIIEDCGFVVEINDGEIIGIGYKEEECRDVQDYF